MRTGRAHGDRITLEEADGTRTQKPVLIAVVKIHGLQVAAEDRRGVRA
jgi:hypothetical protein